MTERSFTIRLRPDTATNAIGVAGLAAIVVAIGGLAGIWWAVLAAGLIALAAVVLVQNAGARAAAGDKAADILHMPPRTGAASARNGATA